MKNKYISDNMKELDTKEIKGLKSILEKYSDMLTEDEIKNIEDSIEYLEKSILDNAIATNIINLLSDILQNALARSLTKENIESLMNMEVKND